jgi:hypothetical protein
MNYPTDRKSCGYAIRFIKVLLNSDAIRDFGTEPVMLAIFIASREDRLHYSKPPKFWRAELMDKFGKGSPKDFLRIRNEAVEAGLLFHKEGTKKTPGLYWTLVPDWLLPRFEAFPKRNGIKSTRSQNGTEKGTESGTEKGTHSIPITHTPNKDTASLDFSNEDIQTAKWMFGLIQCIHPSHKPPSFEKWASNIRLMRERDSRTDSEIRRLFAAANSDSFWQKNILSPDKLRKQWDRLVIALQARDRFAYCISNFSIG